MQEEIKYKKEIDEMLRHVFHEDWMDESDWQEITNEIFSKTVLSYKDLSEAIELGVERGYPVEAQMEYMRHYFAPGEVYGKETIGLAEALSKFKKEKSVNLHAKAATPDVPELLEITFDYG